MPATPGELSLPSRSTHADTTPPRGNRPPGGRRALDRWWLERLLHEGFQPADEARAGPPPELEAGAAQFNGGQFFESHETWERVWRSTDYPLCLFYLALTKLGAGFTHAQRGNPTAMRRLLDDGLRYLEPFAPSIMGLDIGRLSRDVRRWLSRKHASPPNEFPRIEPVAPEP